MSMAPLFQAEGAAPATGFAALFASTTPPPLFTGQWPAPPPPPAPAAAPPEPQPSPADVLALARAEAEALLAAARTEAERGAREAAEEAARQAREAQHAAFRVAGDDLLARLEAAWAARLDTLERDLALLATEVAEKVLGQSLAVAPEAVLTVARAALQRLESAARVQLVVAPADEPLVRQAQAELAGLLAEHSRLEVRVDPALSPGGCLAHGDQASVDARLETRLEACDRVLREGVA